MRTVKKMVAAGGVAVLATVAASSYAVAEAQGTEQASYRPVTQAEIAGLFTTWNAALATGDANKVADLYAPDAILLPTLSDVNRTNRAAIIDYFANDFLPKKPQGAITESSINILDQNTATRSGDYTFTLTDAAGATQQVRARYTFIYEKIKGRWLISTQHSSLEPPAKTATAGQ